MKSPPRRSFVARLTALLGAIVALLVVQPPAAHAADGYLLTADVAYGPLSRQKLDIYVPKDAAPAGSRPVVVFFYGGGWEIGRRERYRFVGKALTREGIAVVIPDYRVYPEARFPDFVADGAAAVRWVRDNIARVGADPGRIFVMGHSAGAHIAAMLALDPHYLASAGMRPAELRGMIGLAGPYDALALATDRVEMIFGPERDRWRSEPVNFVNGRNPPMLLVTGTDDATVPPASTRRLAARIRACHGSVRVIEYSGMGHVDLLTGLASTWTAKVRRDVAAFVREH